MRLASALGGAAPAVQSAVAAGLAWYLAHDVVGHRSAFFAPIAALIVLGVAAANPLRRVVELTLGVAVGIAVGDLLIALIGTGAWQVALVVLLSTSAATLLGGGPLLVTQAASSGVLVATVTGGHNGSRFVDAVVGGVVGVGVLVAFPRNPVRLARRAGARVFAELSAALGDVADALERRDVAAARQALARTRAAEPTVVRWQETVSGGREMARLSPMHWAARTRLAEYAAAAAQLELAVRNARVLARASIRAVEVDPRVPPELPAAVRHIATAVREVEGALERRDRSAPIEAALAATTLATRALELDPELATAHVVGQVRALATDLLRALGIEQGAAVERVRQAAA